MAAAGLVSATRESARETIVPTSRSRSRISHRSARRAALCLAIAAAAASGSALATGPSLDWRVSPGYSQNFEFQGRQVASFVLIQNLSGLGILFANISYDIGAQLPGWTYLSGTQLGVCSQSPFEPAGVTFSETAGVLGLSDLDIPATSSCAVPLALQIPDNAPPGLYLTTATGNDNFGDLPANSEVSASLVTAEFWVLGGLTFEKEFIDDAYAGGTVELRFTITNRDPNYAHQDIAFTDDLGAALTDLASITGPQSDICGTGSSLSGTTELTFADGVLPPSGTCSFSVFVEVPAGADPNLYSNETSIITSRLDAAPVADLRHYLGDTASADLIVLDASALLLHTQGIIERFAWNRAGALSEAGPALQHFLDRFTGNAENGFSSELLAYQQIPDGGGGAAFDAVMVDPGARWAAWLEGTFERYREGGPGTLVNGGVVMLQGGFDVLLGDHLILGVTAVGDGARELSTDFGYFIEGLGWMAGPYGAVRLAEGVVFDAKFLWGQSWNDISPFLTYTDQFTTTRWLATARLSGEAAIGRLMFRPEIYVAYFNETQAEYVDNNGINIPEQTINLGRLTFGPEIAIPVQTSNGGTIEPRIAMEGVWDFIGTQPISARVNGGIQFSGAGGASLLLSGGYGGLFAPAFSNWNVRANITVPLH